VTPYRVAFVEDDDLSWTIVELVIDMIFAFDILANFLSPFYDATDCLVVKRRLIARNYITSWFFVDVISCFPFQLLTSHSFTSLLSRLPRLYRLLKVSK
jgi:hypothetical protein